MSKKKKPAKPAGTYPKGINLPLRHKDYDNLKALAARLTEQRGTTVHKTDLLREGLQVVFAKYNEAMTEPIILTDQEKEDLAPHVKALIDTVAHNMFHDAVRAAARQWGIMDERNQFLPKHDDKVWPPMPEASTVMRDGIDGVEKDFTKRYCKCYEVGTAHGVATRFECINGQSKTMPIRMSEAIGAGLKCMCGNSVAR